jgi:BrxA
MYGFVVRIGLPQRPSLWRKAVGNGEGREESKKALKLELRRRCVRAMPASAIEMGKRLWPSASYSSKIIKAGALIGDTKTLLSHWDVDASVDENISRAQRDNVFGKASRSRVEAILAIFRQRYLAEESVTKALVTLVREKFPSAALVRLFYFHSARADRLLHDAATEILVPMQRRGLVDINVQDFHGKNAAAA